MGDHSSGNLGTKRAERETYTRDRRDLMQRYKADPETTLAEFTWICPYCSKTLAPTVLKDPLGSDDVFIIRKDRCGCPGEVDALQAEQEEAAQSLTTYAQMQRNAALNRAGLTGDYAGFTFANYQGALGTLEGQRKDMVREYCDALLAGRLGADAWLVMWGPYGTGKTHLGAAVLHEAIEAGKLCYLRVWPEWLESIQATFGGKGDSGPIVRELKQGHVVMIDDVDKYPPAKGDEVSWAQSKLYTALANRHKERRPTILTFNHEPNEMVPWLGASIVDRMLERTYAVIHCTGKSWRSDQQWAVQE